MSELEQIFSPDFWNKYEIAKDDLEFLFNRLLELEEPQTIDQLLEPLIINRIKNEKLAFIRKQTEEAILYKPKDKYSVDQLLIFPAMHWIKGKVLSSRSGYNPQIGEFSVIQVDVGNNGIRQFASQLESHALNDFEISTDIENENDFKDIFNDYGDVIRVKLTESLETDPDLVRIAGCYFPKSLLIDINQGHLNLSEAILEEVNGGPLPTQKLIEQVEIPPNVNKRLMEFSMNYALQEDSRFD